MTYFSVSGRRKHHRFITGVAAALLIFTSAYSQSTGLIKRYPKTTAGKYWFETENDLSFSEEILLPGYSAKELGKLEYPALAVDSRNVVYLAYDFTDEQSREGIYLTFFDNAKVEAEEVVDSGPERRYLRFDTPPVLSAPVQVSTFASAEYRPRIAVTSEDVVWVVWSARRNRQWDIFARSFAGGHLGEEIQLTSDAAYDFRPVVQADASGGVWVAWERATANKNIQIVAKSLEHGKWSRNWVLEERPGYAYRPAICVAPDGAVWFAWDFTAGQNTDVYIARFKDGILRRPVQVTSHPAIDSKAALTWYDGKIWVAWTTNRRGTDDWGIIRFPMLRAFDGKQWYAPVDSLKGIDLHSQAEMQSYEYPTITFDPYGRLYLFTRHDHVFNGAFYENGIWSDNWLLDEAAWGLRGFYVHTVWTAANELWMVRRDRKSIFLQKMLRKNPVKSKIRLKKVAPVSYAKELRTTEEPGFRGPSRQGRYRVFYGDLHVHTAYSDGSGSFDDLYNLYKNVYKLDFLAITDHDALRLGNNHLSPGEWAYLKALNEIYNRPGEFVTLNAYEWTHSTWSGRQDSTVRVGHKNVYFKGGEESPFFNHHGKIAYDVESLFRTLHKHDAIAFPHHPPWGGMTWHDHDPDIQTNYEIVSIHGANEYMGNLPIPHRGGLPETFAQDGLAKGKVIGFVGASDSHGLYFHAHEGWRADAYKGGWTGVLLDSTLTRENVWQALKMRRNYATAGEKYFIDFSINGHPMGSEITAHKPPVITFEVRSLDILYAYIIRNNEVLWVSGKIGGDLTAYRGMKDETIPEGDNFYYLRVLYKDGTLAWSSPIWVHFNK